MADYTAIVEAGDALVALLRDRLTPEPIGDREHIALASPYESENNQLTVSLYHAEEEPPNAAAPYYQQSRNVERARPSGFELYYLITAHSNAPARLRDADKYRIIGAAIQALKDSPELAREYLSGSLESSGAVLHISVERVNFEQLSKIWNNTTVPYKLSIVCRVSGVTIDSKRERAVKRVGEIDISVQDISRRNDDDKRRR
jgi:hypothetical protein